MSPPTTSKQSVGAHFHSLLRKKRGEIKALSDSLPRMKTTLKGFEEEYERIKDKPAFFRKAKGVEANMGMLREAIERLERGDHEKEFEEKVAPFSREFVRRREEEETKKRKKSSRLVDHIPQVKKKKFVLQEQRSDSKIEEDMIATIGTDKEDDPEVVIDELMVELDDEDSKLYMNPHDICDNCDIAMEIAVTHPLLICPQCQKTRPFLDVTSASMGFGRNMEFNRFNYERHGHFWEIMGKAQAKKKIDVALDAYERIMTLLAQRNIPCDKLTIEHVHDAVHDLKLNKYYPAIPQIHSVLTNQPLEMFSEEQKSKLYIMFRAVQEPFEEAEKTRRNFVAYNYCMHKLVQLIGLNYWTTYFPLLKGPKNLQTHDEIWRFICKQLDWEFVPST